MAKKAKDSNLSIEERLEQALVPNWNEPYKLPENWCWVRVDAISSIYTGNSINEHVKKEKYTGRTDGLVYLATKDIDFDSTIDYDTNVCIPQSDGFKVAPKYSTLLCIEGGSAGRKIGFITQDVCFVNKLCAFVPHGKINPKYLYYVIQSDDFKKQFDAKKHGLIGGVSVKEVSSIFIPFAPVEIQNKLVVLVESVFTKLDEAKQKAQDALDSFKTRKDAILHKAFSGELTAKWREENGVGMESWTKESIADLCNSLKYGTAKKSQATGEVVVLRMGNLQNGEIDWSDLAYTDDPEDIDKYMLSPGDVLFNRTNSAALVGKTSIYRGEYPAIYAGYLIKLDYDHSIIIGEYLNYALNTTDAREYCNTVKTDGVNQSNINAKKIGAYEINVASIDEQKEIVLILKRLLESERQAKETAEAVLEQIGTIKKSILSRAFRGELGTNTPTEESAVELLKQVLHTAPEQRKTTVKRAVIPKSLENRIKTDLERKIIKLYFQNKVDVLTIDLIMSVSSKKFDIMEALRDLQQRGILEKENNKYKLLG